MFFSVQIVYDDKKGGADMSDKRKKVILDLMEEDFYVPMKEKELAVMTFTVSLWNAPFT